MKMCRSVVTIILCALLVVAGARPTWAQAPHVVDPSAIARMVGEEARRADATRAEVLGVLRQPAVAAAAAAAGVDLTRVTSAVDTLPSADLERAAEAARALETQAGLSSATLAGGASTITISTTTIIIGLLILILIIVAVD